MELCVTKIFNSHLRESFDQIREAGDIEAERPVFSTSVVDTAVQDCVHGVSCACGDSPRTQWWIQEVGEAVKMKKESYQTWLTRLVELEVGF